MEKGLMRKEELNKENSSNEIFLFNSGNEQDQEKRDHNRYDIQLLSTAKRYDDDDDELDDEEDDFYNEEEEEEEDNPFEKEPEEDDLADEDYPMADPEEDLLDDDEDVPYN